MTLLPLNDVRVKGVKGKPFPLPYTCEAPACDRKTDHGHHLWRKTFAGDYNWVEVPGKNGQIVIANKIGLCVGHHMDVTGGPGGHRAEIEWDQREEMFWWRIKVADSESRMIMGHIEPLRALDETVSSDRDKDPVVQSPERCESCGRRKPQPYKGEKKRRRVSWPVKVPQDAEEDGALILDELSDEIAEIFGRDYDGPIANTRYWIIVDAFITIIQNKEKIVGDSQRSALVASVEYNRLATGQR